MAWTQDDLTEINKAIATGARRVRFQTHEVEYRSLDEMMRVRDAILEQVNSSAPSTGILFTDFRDGRS